MKYLYLPIHLLRFWYPESLVVLLRIWKNSVLYLEEDLAVGLMFKLLFVPLFHDTTIFGRVLSFFFRLARIFIGLFAILVVSIILLILSFVWFLTPILAVIVMSNPGFIFKGLLFCGIVLFIRHIAAHPEKKVWQIKRVEDIWQSSWLSKNDLDLIKLLKKREVQNLLLYLEQKPENFVKFAQVDSKDVLQKVWEIGRNLKVPYLGPEHFFVAWLGSFPAIDRELLGLELKLEDFVDTLDFLKRKAEWWKMFWVWDEDFHIKHLRGVNRGWMGVPTRDLDGVSDDLTHKATKEYIPDFVGRQEVVSRVINILSLEKGRNVVIVGEPGSGRGALISYLAKLIISGDAPASLATKRLVKLDNTRLLAGIKTEGELAERIKNIFDEVEASGNIIVYVDEIQNLGIGEAGSQFNLYSLLLPYLESSTFQFVAVTENASFTRIIEKNASFAQIFTKIELPPASVFETVDILKNQAIDHERTKKIRTSLLAMKKIAELTNEYIHEFVLPDAALQVFEECLVGANEGWISKSVVEKVIHARTNVPIGEAAAETKQQLLNMEEVIHQKMIDQEEAVAAVSRTLRRAAAELRDSKRPIGSFLFVGPTGVGKTELAKTLVDVFFQGKGHFARFDMSEYQNSESISRLIGGSGEEGQLTEAVRQHPYSLILLDEFEKANEKVLTLFLQVLDDGRLTSGSGKTVDFTNTIIIATSNAASLTIAQGISSGKTVESIEPEVRNELLQIFKPELVNRFDEVVLFKPLSVTDLQKVVLLKIKSLQDQLKEKGYDIEFAADLIQKLAEKGYDPVLGARPLRRLIQDTIEAKLSVMILQNQLPKGQKFVLDAQLLN